MNKRANPYRIPFLPRGAPGGFFSGHELVLLLLLIAIISAFDLGPR